MWTVLRNTGKVLLRLLSDEKARQKAVSGLILLLALLLLPLWVTGALLGTLESAAITAADLTEGSPENLDVLDSALQSAGLSEENRQLAVLFYVACLSDREPDELLAEKLAEVFADPEDTGRLTENIRNIFDITLNEEDIRWLEEFRSADD